jgi:hypothetical protein
MGAQDMGAVKVGDNHDECRKNWQEVQASRNPWIGGPFSGAGHQV